MTASGTAAALTAWYAYLPGPDAPPAERARTVLGRKGLLYKETATRLALCAVHRALGRADGDGTPPDRVDPRTAVVASSNLGNVGTVAGIVTTARADGWRAVSPLSAPNASPNVVASSVAIWFGFGGPCLMCCSGATSGLDALAAGLRLLAAGRADRVVVVGAEPDDDIAVALHATRPGCPGPLRAGAACLVLEPLDRVPAPHLVVGPVRTVPGDPPDGHGTGGEGGHYGADGLVPVALAADALRAPGGPAVVEVRCGDDEDGFRAVTVRAAPDPGSAPRSDSREETR
ncbi:MULTISPECIES: beta-ketoacyl synthase N-terminal-like domain-containing protein [Micromonospora]|uniref:beta-ketoacyl synthase N-terminal-like domain-containing protein n=1 Tax=Micromonospora TaxID=1873 RepID=UPI0021C7C4B6|nr:beta-ketoacyl synthase N-terminal-like domain-containing protein [Micromonospora sp. Mcm103]